MKVGLLVAVVAVLAFGASEMPARVAAAGPIACASLGQLPLTNATVISAEVVQAGAFTPPPGPANASAASAFSTLPAFCRVTVRLTPTPDSDIRVEVWLPLVGWNRKVQAVGNGGLGGTMPYGPLGAAIRAGYAAAGTDTGHVGGNADFVAGHPEKLVDFAFRAIHEMTVTAKTVVPRTTMRGRRSPTSIRARREDGRRSSKRNVTRRISTGSSRATRRGIRCGSMPPVSP